MNIKTIVAALALTVAFAAPAMAGSFSFNKSSADEMIAAAKEEGITLPKEVADAIVTYRATNPIKTKATSARCPASLPSSFSSSIPSKTATTCCLIPPACPA